MKRSKACQNLTGFPEIGKQVVGSAPDADCFVAFHGNPIHVNCIVPAFDNAMLFTSTNIWAARPRCLLQFQGILRHTPRHTGCNQYICLRPLWVPISRSRCEFLSLVSVTYFTMIVPFIHGCGAH